MNPTTEALRQVIEQPKDATFWGESYRIVPAFIDEVFGDGRKLAYVEPINSRPNYYVARVDSRWSPGNGGGGPTLGEMSGAILDAARERWGDAWPDDEPERRRARRWPAVATDDGCSYGTLDWPPGFEPRPDGADAMVSVLREGSRLSDLDPYAWRRLAAAALDSLELHLDPVSSSAVTAACEAAFGTLQGWRRREDGAVARGLFGARMPAAIEAALLAEPAQRRLRLTGLPGTHVVERMQVKDIAIFDAPVGLGLSEIVALQAIASGIAPAYGLVGRTVGGTVPLRIVDAHLKLDTAETPYRFSPGTLETLSSIRVRENGVVTRVPCIGMVFREDELPQDEDLAAFVRGMRGTPEAPAAAPIGPSAG